MVDVSNKQVTTRRAVAEGLVTIPASINEVDDEKEWWTPKGPVFQTAVIAGIQGAKATATTVPLCHPLPLSSCDVTVEPAQATEESSPDKDTSGSTEGDRETTRLVVRCTVETAARTGVEMEALCGVSAACLTVYDMGKSVTHGIVIERIELVEKSGGKRDWHR